MLRTMIIVGLLFLKLSIAYAEPVLGFYDSGEAVSSAHREKWLGKPVMLSWRGGTVNYFLSNTAGWHLGPVAQWLKDRPGRQVHYTLFIFRDSRPAFSKQTLAECGKGTYDQDYIKAARAFKIYGLTNMILRIGHEFTGKWYSWSSVGKEGSYVNCYRRVVDVMRKAVPENNWKFDWNPTIQNPVGIFNATYPGDKYVDYITTDIYDTPHYPNRTYPYPSVCNAQCVYERQSVNWYYIKLGLDKVKNFAIAKKKPFGISEWGVWSERKVTGNIDGGGDNPYFITQMHKYITNPANNVAYSIYFDTNPTEGHHVLCCGDSKEFPKAAKKFQDLFGVSIRIASIDPLPASIKAGDYLDVDLVIASNAAYKDTRSSITLHDSAYKILVHQIVTEDVVNSLENKIRVRVKVPDSAKAGVYSVSYGLYNSDYTKRLLSKTKFTSINVESKSTPLLYAVSPAVLSTKEVQGGKSLNVRTDVTIAKAEKVAILFVAVNRDGVLTKKIVTRQPASDGETNTVSATLDIPTAAAGNYKISIYIYRASDYQRYFYLDQFSSFKVIP